jgi:hypothetical protein
MFVPLLKYTKEVVHGSSGTNFLARRNGQVMITAANHGNSTQSLLSTQWTNPSDVLSVLLIVGGDIVQKALAQASGGYFTPVCFSFGWVAYSLNTIISIIGDGRLLPEPDHPAKVYNLKNGYVRENKNWIIGRILRDNIMHLNKTDPLGGNGIRISIYDAQKSLTNPSVAGTGYVRTFGVTVMVMQLLIAAIPVILYGEWGIVLITSAGTLLALLAGALPQWRVEKHPGQDRSEKNFALTSGNGSRDIMIIRGNGECLDLEEMAASQMPRSARLWESHPLLSSDVLEGGKSRMHMNKSPYRKTRSYRGIPLGFWITIMVITCQSVLWLCLLITVAGLRSHVWYLLLVGALGMLQNILVAASSREVEKRNLRLTEVEIILARKVMDGLMDLEVTYEGFGIALRDEFFPGKLRDKEVEWWNGKTEPYDADREEESSRRGLPRKYLPKYDESFSNSQLSLEKKDALAVAKLPPKRTSYPLGISIPSLVYEEPRSRGKSADAIGVHESH